MGIGTLHDHGDPRDIDMLTQTVEISAPALLTAESVANSRKDDRLEGHLLLSRAVVRQTQSGHDYLAATFLGHDGKPIEARKWRYAGELSDCLHPGLVYFVEACVDIYNGNRQLKLFDMTPATNIDPLLFSKTTRRTLAELEDSFNAIIASLAPAYAALVQEVLSEDVGERFRIWPAAQSHHGAVRHGLFAHSILTAQIAASLPDPYSLYGLPHDRDVVATACLLHDVGKVFTLPSFPGEARAAEADLFDHVTLGVLLVRNAANRAVPKLPLERLNILLSAILMHHGRKEWGAPMEPGTVEGQLVHLADYCESRLWPWSREEHAVETDRETSKGVSDDAR